METECHSGAHDARRQRQRPRGQFYNRRRGVNTDAGPVNPRAANSQGLLLRLCCCSGCSSFSFFAGKSNITSNNNEQQESNSSKSNGNNNNRSYPFASHFLALKQTRAEECQLGTLQDTQSFGGGGEGEFGLIFSHCLPLFSRDSFLPFWKVWPAKKVFLPSSEVYDYQGEVAFQRHMDFQTCMYSFFIMAAASTYVSFS